MPKYDAPAAPLSALGHAKQFWSPGKHRGPAGTWEIRFDTGAILYVPDAIMGGLSFTLPEA